MITDMDTLKLIWDTKPLPVLCIGNYEDLVNNYKRNAGEICEYRALKELKIGLIGILKFFKKEFERNHYRSVEVQANYLNQFMQSYCYLRDITNSLGLDIFDDFAKEVFDDER